MYSSHMAIYQPTSGFQYWQRHHFKQIIRCHYLIWILYAAVFCQVVFIIVENLFVGTPAALELHEAQVFRLGSTEAETAESFPGIPFDGLPHGKIVGPEVLTAAIGCTVFIDSLIAEMKKDGTGNSFVFRGSQENSSFFRGNNVFKKVFKKLPGLGRQAVAPSCHTIETIKFPYGRKRVRPDHGDVIFFSLFNIPPGTASEPFGDFVYVFDEVQGVGKKSFRRRLGLKQILATAEFD